MYIYIFLYISYGPLQENKNQSLGKRRQSTYPEKIKKETFAAAAAAAAAAVLALALVPIIVCRSRNNPIQEDNRESGVWLFDGEDTLTGYTKVSFFFSLSRSDSSCWTSPRFCACRNLYVRAVYTCRELIRRTDERMSDCPVQVIQKIQTWKIVYNNEDTRTSEVSKWGIKCK